MVHGGMSQKMVCRQLGISRSQLHVWLKRDRQGLGLQTKPGRGRKTELHQVAKRVIKMAAQRLHQSTRKLARRLTKAGYKTSHMMVTATCATTWACGRSN